MLPPVASVKPPAWLVAAAVQVVLSSWSHHSTRLPSPPAPSANMNLSSVLMIAVLLVGAFVMTAAAVDVLFCHS